MSEIAAIRPDRWRENWRFVAAPRAVQVVLPRSRRRRRQAAQVVRELAAGSPVVLACSGPGAGRWCRAFAASTGVEVEREFLAFPSAAAPAFVVEDAGGSARLFLRNMLVAPPRSTWPVELGVALVRGLGSWRVLRLVAPGRLLVGRTT